MYINPRFRSVPRSTNPITLSSFMPTFKQQPQQPLPPQQSNSNPKQRNDYRPVFLGKNSTGHQFLKDQGDVFVFGQGICLCYTEKIIYIRRFLKLFYRNVF